MSEKSILDLATEHSRACQLAAAQQAEAAKPVFGVSGMSFRPGKQIHSAAAGVHPKQIAEAEQKAAACGVPTKFDASGKPIYTSWRHRDKHLKAMGWVVYDKQ